MAVLAGAPGSRIVMLARSGRSTKSFAVQSVTFDHAAIGKLRLNGPAPASPSEIILVAPASAATQAALKPTTKLAKVDLVLYVTDSNAHQRLRSQLELGNSTVSEYKLSVDKKTATVKLSAKIALISEQVPTASTDWVTSG